MCLSWRRRARPRAVPIGPSHGDEEDEVMAGGPLAVGLHTKEVGALPDATIASVAQPASRRRIRAEAQTSLTSPRYFLKIETVRRFRPLRRRLARTFAPPLVAMRARKPCVRRRRVLCG